MEENYHNNCDNYYNNDKYNPTTNWTNYYFSSCSGNMVNQKIEKEKNQRNN